MKLNEKITDLLIRLNPLKDIAIFMAVVAIIHFGWKLSMNASPDDTLITFLTYNVSKPFLWISNHFTILTQFIINDIFGIETFRYNQQLYFDNSPGITIVWACSGVKQYLMLVAAILFAKGSIKRKICYLPLALVLMYVLNVFRLVMLTLVTRYNIEWFDFTHKVIFRLIIYGGLFFLWWLWIEKISLKTNNKTQKQ